MSLKYLALTSDTPMIACRNGISEHPGYMKCGICAYTAVCEIYQRNNLADFIQQAKADSDARMEKLRRESLEVRATTYRNENNFWCDDDGWKRMKKFDHLKGTSPLRDCLTGFARHPDFWKCEKCAELPNCNIGKFRMQKAEQEKLQRRQKLEKIFQPFKKFFEAVAEVFDKLKN